MKKLVTLMLAAGLAFTAVNQASAVEIKPFGMVEFNFEYNDHLGVYEDGPNVGKYAFMDTEDAEHNFREAYHGKKFRPTQRFIVGADFIVSEALSAHLDFIAGNFTWGGPANPGTAGAANGGALGSRATNIVTRQAYLDWMLPNTDIKVRMGHFAWVAPWYAVGAINPFQGDEFGTGIQVNIPFNKNVSATIGWLRAASDTRRGNGTVVNTSRSDTFDMFTLFVPVKMDGWAMTPWGAFGLVGKDVNSMSEFGFDLTATGNTKDNPLDTWGNRSGANLPSRWMPVAKAAHRGAALAGHASGAVMTDSTVYFIGLGGELTMFDPFRIAFDAGYSGISTDHDYTDRKGWMVGAALSYKTAYGVPTLKAWYTSGDDDDVTDGSERPIMTGAFKGGANVTFKSGNINGTMVQGLKATTGAGTWGVSLQWNNFSFMKDLTHNFHVTYIQGTNDKYMARFADPAYISTYMTTKDSLVEINFESVYKIYQNFSVGLELAYLIEDFDGKLWNTYVRNAAGDLGERNASGKMKFSNAFHTSLNFRYTF